MKESNCDPLLLRAAAAENEKQKSIFVFFLLSNLKCYPWLETDASAAGSLVSLYARLTDTLHHKFRGRLHQAPGFLLSWCFCFLLSVLLQLFISSCLQIVCFLAREALCGCVWFSTVRAALLPAHLSTFSTCTTRTSAACPGVTCTQTLSSCSSFLM